MLVNLPTVCKENYSFVKDRVVKILKHFEKLFRKVH